MEIVKNEYRNRLTQSSMCDLLTLQLHAPEIPEYDTHDAIHYWNSCGVRSRQLGYNCSIAEVAEEALDGDQESAQSAASSSTGYFLDKSVHFTIF